MNRSAVPVPLRRQAAQVVRGLRKTHPHVTCALEYATPFQLLIATILSAQCTDARVNVVTRDLFARYPDARSLASIRLSTLESIIRSTGFFRQKAKHIRGCARRLVEAHAGEVPADLQLLTQLPGVGRKTANVVLGTAFQIASGVVVDTHVGRLSRRLGLTQEQDPLRVERDLMAIVPRSEWIAFSHRMIHHGRQYCLARKPRCEPRPLVRVCPQILAPRGNPSPRETSP